MEKGFSIDIIIFIAVIVANIFAALIKMSKDKKKRKYLSEPDLPALENEITEEEIQQMFFDPETFKKYNNISSVPPAPQPEVRNTPPPPPAPPQEKPAVEVKEQPPFDYINFIREHGREAFVLSEIILPVNSRRGSSKTTEIK